MLIYNPKQDNFLLLNINHDLCEWVTHDQLDNWLMYYEKPSTPSFYELVEMFPTAIPTIKRNLKKENTKEAMMKLRYLNPIASRGTGLTAQDIAQAKSTPIKNFLKVNRQHKAVCLFHNDKNASMHIYGTNYYCFSCQAKGSVVDIIMKLHNKPFKDAVLFLIGKE